MPPADGHDALSTSGRRHSAGRDTTDADEIGAPAHRAAELLALGVNAVEEMGRRVGSDAADALKLLDAISRSTTHLLDVNQRLLPLMMSLGKDRSQNRFLRWFTGQELESEVFLGKISRQIETLAQSGQRSHDDMEQQIHMLTVQNQLMHTEISLLETEIAAGRLLATAAYTERRASAGITDDDLARLQRRTGNLEAMASATQLTRAQYVVAIQHAKAVADRYREIRTLLLPIWKQAAGFDLFSRRIANYED
jgi:hypothetical protein